MLKITTLTIIALASFTVAAEPEIKGTPSELAQYLRSVPRITVLVGEAEVRVPAQRAVVSLKVTTDHKALQEALHLNLEFRNRLVDHLKKQGIPAERILASKFSSTPKFGVFTDKAKAYKVENLIRITVQDEKEFHSVASAVDKWSEVQFAGVEFEYSDKEALKAKALERACEDATRQKKRYEESFGVQLTPVSFQPGNVSPLRAGGNYGAFTKGAYSSGLGAVPSEASSPEPAQLDASVSSLGEMVYTARVSVEYSVQVGAGAP